VIQQTFDPEAGLRVFHLIRFNRHGKHLKALNHAGLPFFLKGPGFFLAALIRSQSVYLTHNKDAQQCNDGHATNYQGPL
jgi:hypothetical protein